MPLPAPFDVTELARRLRMALVKDERHGLWALGPESGAHALASAELPEIVLPDPAAATSSCDRCGERR